MSRKKAFIGWVRAALPALALVAAASGQDRFERLPGHDRYAKVSGALDELGAGGRVGRVEWTPDGQALLFDRSGTRYRYDLGAGVLAPALPEAPPQEPLARPRDGRPPVARGMQGDREPSPDGTWSAACRDYNVVLERADGSATVRVTTGGHRKLRYGRASWVYGEELDQVSAMWWSPDSRRLAFYEFDETGVTDYYLTTGLTKWRTELAVEGYPKAGEPNPVARLLVYDVQTRRTTRIATGDDPQSYVYAVRFSPDGRYLLFNRTNRFQNVLELVAADPQTGTARVVVSETQRTWQDNRPHVQFLADGQRFIWETEKTGFAQYELRDLDGRLLAVLTRGRSPVAGVVRVDEAAGFLYFMAYDEDRPLDEHLHRVRLDGTEQVRLTAEPMSHRVWLSPDAKWFVTTYETVEDPPATALYSVEGGRAATLAEPDAARFLELGLEPPELFTYKADDGVTDLYGVLFKPSDFDAAARYPLVLDVYGGPLSKRVRQRYRGANPFCELGFLIAVVDNRGTTGRGKAFEEAVYLQCGTVDLKDQADGVRHLSLRPYVDAGRVGVMGHSYGGYMAALAILKHPDVFRAAVASSPVTDWRNYDTIYTERYMRTPQENPQGYELGSCLTYAGRLEGSLLLLHGMVDDNVHPANAWQLVHALQQARKPFSMVFYPEAAHGLGREAGLRGWEFLHDELVAGPAPSILADRPAAGERPGGAATPAAAGGGTE